MQTRTKYFVADEVKHMAAALGLSTQNILRRANLPLDFFDQIDPGLSPQQMFTLWDAAAREYPGDDLPIILGKFLANGESGSIILAFTCSHSVAEGFDRIALFKPLAGPFKLETKRTNDAFTVSIRSSLESLPLPPIVTAMDVVFFVELLRTTTGENIIPLRATLPVRVTGTDHIENFIGIPIDQGDRVTVSFDPAVADLPLVTENTKLLAYYERDLKRKLEAHGRETPTTDRLRGALQKMLPSGKHTADDACRRLGLSKRTLQRQLAAENTTYQAVLDTTRSDLSLHYLRKHKMNVEEVSYLLAYRDPNSFYRAFQNWTGMTPAQARTTQV